MLDGLAHYAEKVGDTQQKYLFPQNIKIESMAIKLFNMDDLKLCAKK